MIIKKRKLMLILVMVMLLNIPYIRQTYNNIINLVIQIIIILLYISINKTEKSSIESCIVLFSIGTVVSTIINYGFSTRVANAFVTSMEYILMFLVFKDAVKKYDMDYVIDIIFKFLRSLIIIVDIFIIITKAKGFGGSGVLSYYLIGNKFAVSYYHMLFIGIIFYKNNLVNKKYKLNLIIIILSMIICKQLDCNTGLIGVFAVGMIAILINYSEILCKIIQKPIIYIIFLILINFLLLGSDFLLKNEMIKWIIEELLNRNMALTGRLKMFEISWNAILEKIWFGYGINSTYVEDILGFGNAQNGILKILLDYGIVGFVLFIYVCVDSMKTKNKKMFPIIAFLFGMAICSTVEINISGIFFLGLALMNASKYNIEHEKIINENNQCKDNLMLEKTKLTYNK